MANAVGVEVRVTGMKRALDVLSPSRRRRAFEGARGLGARYLLRVIRTDSRVGKTGDYKATWRQERIDEETRAIINDIYYAEYVTGKRQRTTLPGRRRQGSGDAFMARIKRDHTAAVRKIMRDRIMQELKK